MRAFRLLTLVVVGASWVCAASISSIAQEAAVVRVGVTVPLGVDKTVSATGMRDRLVKALDGQKVGREKPDHRKIDRQKIEGQKSEKTMRFSVEAVALATEWG